MARSNPDTDTVMPAVLELLKRETEMKKAGINEHMRKWIEAHGFDERDRSIGWALNRLSKEGHLSHPRIGSWRVTPKGMATVLSPEEATRIMLKWTAIERANRARK